MKLGGFALKKGKRKALGASAGFSASVSTAPASPQKVFVTDFDPNAPAELSTDGQKPLVIPLLETNSWQEDQKPKDQKKDQNAKSLNTGNTDVPKAAEQQAAAQILAEARSRDVQDAPQTLVIPITSGKDKKRAELFTDGEKRPQNGQKRPILQQNAVPGLDNLQDVTDKYRHDVALRPEAPDVHSDVYESVPVEAFGAALLRGMGWKGDVDPDDVGAAPQPRHKLLGLGATKRPSVPGEDKKKRKKRKDESKDKQGDRRSGLNTEKESSGRDGKERRSRRSADRERRRSRSESRSDHRKRSRSRSRDRDRGRGRGRDRGRDRDRDGRSRSRSRSDRHSRRR